MKILFDSTAFVIQARGGVSRVLYELFAALSTDSNASCRIFAGFHRNRYLRDAPAHIKARVIGVYLPSRIIKPRIFLPINRFLCSIYAYWFQPDICHFTYFDTPKVPARCKTVVTVHDMIVELFPSLFDVSCDESNWKAKAVAAADGVICVSENTKTDLTRILPLNGKPTEVVYHGNSMRFDNAALKTIDIDSRYWLYVGNRGLKYKNFDVVLRAFSERLCQYDVKLVCFGGGSFTSDEFERFKELGVEGNLLHSSGHDSVLASYYKSADCLIYPSIYEGFGLPPIEAMAIGCPVVSSSAPPMPEIIGRAGLFFEPDLTQSLLDQISLLNDSEIRDQLIKLGHQQVSRYNWKIIAEQALGFYESLVEENSVDAAL